MPAETALQSLWQAVASGDGLSTTPLIDLPMTALVDWILWLWACFVANRENIVSFLTLIGGGIGIYLLAIRTRAANRSSSAALEQAKTATDRHNAQTDADRERRITESFARAVEQLGSEKLETRLGSI